MTAIPRWKVYLRLGRVSNLPTVWTNVVAAIWLAGVRPGLATVALLAAAMSLFYVGGMFLNDAFDRAIDARQRPDRPIPAGLVSAREVFAVGYGLLAAGELTLALHYLRGPATATVLLSGLALAGAIVLYNRWHKNNPLSPLLMGLCRVLVYLTAAFAVRGDLSREVIAGAAVLLSYLIGLTYAAKQENLDHIGALWPLGFLAVPFVYCAATGIASLMGAALYLALLAPVAMAVALLRGQAKARVPRAVMLLIAAMSLLDALLLVRSGGSAAAALVTALGFPATLFLQRYVRGT